MSKKPSAPAPKEKKEQELIVDGKPIWQWAENNGWIQIGSWQCDPTTISIQQINEIVAWEEITAKRDILEKLEDQVYKWLQEGLLEEKQYKMLINYIALICPELPESKLPGGSND